MPTPDEPTRPGEAGDGLAPLSGDQEQTWAAIRARLSIECPWITAALFRATPVDAATHLPANGPAATPDRWGRIYLDPARETDLGIATLATQVRDAVLTWVSGTAGHQPWFAARLDDRFAVVAPAQQSAAAHHAAAGIAATQPPRFGSDSLADWREWAHREAGTPQVSWQQHLGAALRSAAGSHRGRHAPTYARPGRRQLPGILTPAWRSPDLHTAVIADVSGSVTPDLPTVIAETQSILGAVATVNGSLTLYTVDDEVVDITKLPGKLPPLDPRSGHGTDLRAGFTALSRPGRPADITIVLTDGRTPWPATRPKGTTIVALIGPSTVTDEAAAAVPAWATTVRIDT